MHFCFYFFTGGKQGPSVLSSVALIGFNKVMLFSLKLSIYFSLYYHLSLFFYLVTTTFTSKTSRCCLRTVFVSLQSTPTVIAQYFVALLLHIIHCVQSRTLPFVANFADFLCSGSLLPIQHISVDGVPPKAADDAIITHAKDGLICLQWYEPLFDKLLPSPDSTAQCIIAMYSLAFKSSQKLAGARWVDPLELQQCINV